MDDDEVAVVVVAAVAVVVVVAVADVEVVAGLEVALPCCEFSADASAIVAMAAAVAGAEAAEWTEGEGPGELQLGGSVLATTEGALLGGMTAAEVPRETAPADGAGEAMAGGMPADGVMECGVGLCGVDADRGLDSTVLDRARGKISAGGVEADAAAFATAAAAAAAETAVAAEAFTGVVVPLRCEPGL